MMWSGVFALLGMAVISGALWLWGSDEMDQSAATAEQQAAAPVVVERVVSRFESPSREAALELVKQALQIRDPDKVAAYFRLGSATGEQVVAFLHNMQIQDGPIKDYAWLSSMDANGLLIDGVTVKTNLEGAPHSRLALLTPDDKGKWLIDFEAFARRVKPAWSEIMAQPDGHGQVRVVFTKDHYFNGPFKEESIWTCYRLGSPDLADNLLGYCRKDSPQAAAMARMLAHEKSITHNGALNRATLVIRRVAGADSRQFEIARVMAEDWVLSDTPFDESHQ